MDNFFCKWSCMGLGSVIFKCWLYSRLMLPKKLHFHKTLRRLKSDWVTIINISSVNDSNLWGSLPSWESLISWLSRLQPGVPSPASTMTTQLSTIANIKWYKVNIKWFVKSAIGSNDGWAIVLKSHGGESLWCQFFEGRSPRM